MKTNATIETILARKAYRRFTPDALDPEDLEAIIEAGLHAPSAGGRQGPRILVCQDAQLNEALGRANRGASRERVSTATAYISREQPSILDDTSIKSGFYGAPCVVTIFAPADFLYSEMDSACVAENMMIATTSLGVGSCFVARAKETFQCEEGRDLLARIELPEGYVPFAHVILGYPSTKAPEGKPRKENRVIMV